MKATEIQAQESDQRFARITAEVRQNLDRIPFGKLVKLADELYATDPEKEVSITTPEDRLVYVNLCKLAAFAMTYELNERIKESAETQEETS